MGFKEMKTMLYSFAYSIAIGICFLLLVGCDFTPNKRIGNTDFYIMESLAISEDGGPTGIVRGRA